MKNLLVVLVTMMAVSTTFACMGGDMIQVILEKKGTKIVAANINKRTGAVTLGKGIDSIRTFTADEKSACTDSACKSLNQMEDQDVLVLVTLNDGSRRMKTIGEVTINESMAVVAKAMPNFGELAGLEKDVEGLPIYNCSQK